MHSWGRRTTKLADVHHGALLLWRWRLHPQSVRRMHLLLLLHDLLLHHDHVLLHLLNVLEMISLRDLGPSTP